MLLNKTILKYIFILLFSLFQLNGLAQNKSFSRNDSSSSNNDIYMTWNKTTPETEMKDDIKALSEKGITIKYSNVKRNSKDEIVAIKVEYSDRKGNKGAMELNNQNPINTINFFKQGETVGFGQPSSSNNMIAENDFFNNFSGNENFLKQFNFGNEGENPNSQSFSFNFPNGADSFGNSNSKMIIKKDGKKPLVIENGEVVEGGDDYTKEEIEEIKKNNQFEFSNGNGNQSNGKEFDFRNQEGLENFKKQMEKMQMDMDKIVPNSTDTEMKSDIDKTTKEMIKAKDEMIKAKDEMEKAKKDLEKAKSTLKTQKT